MDAQDIRRSLETEYDIPFFVQTTFDGGEPAFIIGPKNSGKELFTIKVYFRNRIRLHMDFIPQKYSANFIDSMGRQVNRYERNPLNRKLCLAAKGYDCAICGMNFEQQYGPIGYHFIHVHHIVPVSQVGAGYVIDPLKDLIPVCPNCHAMLHRRNPPYLPDELRTSIL